MFSGIKFWLFIIWTLLVATPGWLYAYNLWTSYEAKADLAAAKTIIKVSKANDKPLREFRARNYELTHANDKLKEELAYARSQNTGTCTLGAPYVSVWDDKLAGRPVELPGATGGVPREAEGTGTATVDDLSENNARNAPEWAKCRAALNGVREWACRVHKLCDG